eukprot:1160381-Pelagomonas_calceolata.AAC.11
MGVNDGTAGQTADIQKKGQGVNSCFDPGKGCRSILTDISVARYRAVLSVALVSSVHELVSAGVPSQTRVVAHTATNKTVKGASHLCTCPLEAQQQEGQQVYDRMAGPTTLCMHAHSRMEGAAAGRTTGP